MKLSSSLATDFSSQVRSRGFGYYSSGAVRIKKGSDFEVEARVQGARDYEVEIACEDEQVNLWCDCPFFESTGPCKHLWAAILAAEAKGYLKAAANFGPKQAFYDLPELLFDDEEPEEDDVSYEARRPPFPPPSKPALYRPQPRQPGWREHLEEIAGAAISTNETWPRERQLLYVVDVPTSVARANLIVKLLTREPKKAGGWKKLQAPRMTRSTLAILPDELDR